MNFAFSYNTRLFVVPFLPFYTTKINVDYFTPLASGWNFNLTLSRVSLKICVVCVAVHIFFQSGFNQGSTNQLNSSTFFIFSHVYLLFVQYITGTLSH